MGRRPLGWKKLVSTPLGMISQSSSKYRDIASTTGWLTAIVAACRSRIFWSGRRKTRQPAERRNHEWNVATTGMPSRHAANGAARPNVGATEVKVLQRTLRSFALDSVLGAGHFLQEEQPLAVVAAVARVRAALDRRL